MKPLIDVLIILDALDREGSMASAAAKLYKSASSLSYAVQKLESELNIQILDRRGQRARFTESGRLLLERGRGLLDNVQHLEQMVQRIQQGWERSLVLALDDTLPFSILTPLIATFSQQHPQTQLSLTTYSSSGLRSALRSGAALAIGLREPLPADEEYEFAPLGHRERIFVIAPGHALASQEAPLSHHQLREHLHVVRSHSMDSDVAVRTLRVSSLEGAVQLLLSGLCCGFIERHLVENWLQSGALVARDVQFPPAGESIWMGWNPHTLGCGGHWWRQKILENSALRTL
ncbi:LysR family transcriptional regulator [Salmonella enterica subsp. enterica serovar Choleraesuis]|nr:LysR family transcriptional regulator [Salmonella enterica subsp. enterica serovar Choleraesuis]